MKNLKKIDYKTIIFIDIINKNKFLTKSSLNTNESVLINNKKFFIKKIEISSKSHPLYTKNKNIISVTGKINKFKKKYNLP